MTAEDLPVSVLEVERAAAFDHTRIVSDHLPDAPDAVVLEVQRFSLATNNLGYVMLGDILRSWDAYPSPSPGWGRVPVWGAARVVSAPSAVAEAGAVVTGYLPMATHTALRATAVPEGLLAVDQPRAGMLPIYRRLTAAPPVLAQWDDHQIDVDTVLLAVFPFATLLARDLGYADRVVLSSASSRSAAALARLLSATGTHVTGLTSARHRTAVESFGVYEQVLSYDNIAALPTAGEVVYVDLAGAAEVSAAVRDRLGSGLAATVIVGGTHLRTWSADGRHDPTVSVFNTGDREQELAAEIGQDAIEQLYPAARTDLNGWASQWLQVRTLAGLDAADQTWRDIAAGRSDPLSAVVIRPGLT
ncbi:hypothetical protein BVC93_07655 [Mycobacterium sp. MS1601]|uniref:DUF2855 family protein n=1 Tax=Mycobacterium sp. MS1601 TaxID=1936029 RepID=UPI00097945BE|nr:DUF2855 family protein [Mycobacterium sp. MS1601]AQA02327.1 hypothetical protein BVC93_07655 [Mycobacterium sp. MS1601]